MDKAGVLVPHGVGGYARTMLAAAAHRLAHPAPAPDVALIDVPHQECYSDGDGDTWFDCPDDAEFTQGRKVGDTYEVQRSEEHTSELQSLMRISYAVFCLKKTNT